MKQNVMMLGEFEGNVIFFSNFIHYKTVFSLLENEKCHVDSARVECGKGKSYSLFTESGLTINTSTELLGVELGKLCEDPFIYRLDLTFPNRVSVTVLEDDEVHIRFLYDDEKQAFLRELIQSQIHLSKGECNAIIEILRNNWGKYCEFDDMFSLQDVRTNY